MADLRRRRLVLAIRAALYASPIVIHALSLRHQAEHQSRA